MLDYCTPAKTHKDIAELYYKNGFYYLNYKKKPYMLGDYSQGYDVQKANELLEKEFKALGMVSFVKALEILEQSKK